MNFIGIDPGLNGAISLLEGDNALEIFDMPTVGMAKNKRQVDAAQLSRIVEDWAILHGKDLHAVCEHVHAMTGQGVVSMFNFGMSMGVIKGVLASNNIPVTFVRPSEWKKAMRAPAAKDAARARATELLPAHAKSMWPLKKHDGRAEAALLALYGRSLF